MKCQKCGKSNTDEAQFCIECGAILPNSYATTQPITVRTSRMAIAALVLGLMSLFLFIFAGIPAVILGIISLIIIEKSGGKITGRAFAITGILSPVFSTALIIIIVLLSNVRQHVYELLCGINLMDVGNAMLRYQASFNEQFPSAGGRDIIWGDTISWDTDIAGRAFGSGEATITSSLYLLVKYCEISPKVFICPADSDVTVFEPADYGAADRDIIKFWDFGPNPMEHCSYAYHHPYSEYPLRAGGESGMAVIADKNPFIRTSKKKPKDFGLFNPDGSTTEIKEGNSYNHKGEEQSVLYLDNSVSFQKTSACGINEDNIYTPWESPAGGNKGKGALPIIYLSEPQNPDDSFLVNDG